MIILRIIFNSIRNIVEGAIASCVGNLLSLGIGNSPKSKETIDDHISISHPPPFIDKLIGRKSDVKNLNKKLSKNQAVWISSIGGMGKSTLAIAYAQKYHYKHRKIYWLTWRENLQDTLQYDENICIDGNLNLQAVYDKIIFYFRNNAPKASLLIIDGLDCYTAKEIDIILSFRCKLLITSRIHSSLHVEYELPEMKDEQYRELFEYHAKAKISNEQLDRLLSMTGKHTLAIKLLARYTQLYSIKQMFTDILNGDISNLPKKIEIKDGEPTSSIISYFTRIYSLKCSKLQKELLMNLSILPSDDLKISDLAYLIDKNILDETVPELERLGWLICRRRKSIYLHPVLSSTIRQISINENVNPSVFKNILINATKISSPSLDEFDDFKRLSRHLQYYESIINYYLWEDCYIAQLMMNVSSIRYIQYRNPEVSLENAEKACSILEKIFKSRPSDVRAKKQYARALSDISEFYYMNSCKKAIEIEKKALELKESLPEGPKDRSDTDKTMDLLKSYSNLILYHQVNFEEGYFETAYEIASKYKNDLKIYKRTRANFYNHYALLLRTYGLSNKRIYYSKKAIELLDIVKKILNENDAIENYMYPMIMNSLGAIYGEVFIYDKKSEFLTEEDRVKYKKCALKYLYMAYYCKKQKHHETLSSIATSQHNLAFLWSEIGHNWIALFYERKAIAIRQTINNDNGSEQLNLASSLLRLGIIFTAIYEKYQFRFFKVRGIKNLEKALNIYYKHCQENPNANCENEISACQDKLKFYSNDKVR